MIRLGDMMPYFEGIDSDGKPFCSQDWIGKKAMVVYFYPKDQTPGCTAQACSFRDHYQDFTDLGAEVIGISADSVESHLAFENKYKLPFVLLADKDNTLRKLFGVPKGLFGILPGRVTYVSDKTGKIIAVFKDSFRATKHIEVALEVLRKEEKNAETT